MVYVTFKRSLVLKSRLRRTALVETDCFLMLIDARVLLIYIYELDVLWTILGLLLCFEVNT